MKHRVRNRKLVPVNDERVHYMVITKDGVKYSGPCGKRYHRVGSKHVNGQKKI